MKRLSALALILAIPTMALAANVAPGDVKFDGMSVSEPVADTKGDPDAGRAVFVDRGLGNCLACHQNSEIENAQFPGNVGPSMDGVASRWEPQQLRAIIVNAKEVFGPDTIMPGFYTLDVGVDVAEDRKGKTILSAEEVEDVVAYLATLKQESAQ
ncbi:sulfur oxidation c-type cytochrome SoxX [Fulvimarina sp. MAC3]|uniref:sulfur oxidation c-type cytochrome SoxX n=1 Tax=Fulvimarina sp. MAC3 TaxID=3148887 RepID=UPI0031FBBCEE